MLKPIKRLLVNGFVQVALVQKTSITVFPSAKKVAIGLNPLKSIEGKLFRFVRLSLLEGYFN